ncbi:MAG: hypothetical protein P8J87_14480 [Verrucomicrobiales bacterium]|nr:hypothetical protein [Verrucomicrobiales bacterium]
MNDRLPIISLVATAVLGGTAILLSMQNRGDAVKRQGRLDLMEATLAQHEGQMKESAIETQLMAEAVEEKDRVIAGQDAEIEKLKEVMAIQAQEAQALDTQIQKVAGVSEVPMTPVQRKIAALPAIARVNQYVPDLGFVALNAGSNVQLTEGQSYRIRRDNYMVAKITIGTVEETNAIADVEPGSIPEGFTIMPGDEVIQYFP